MLLIVLFAGGSFWDLFPLRGLTSDNFCSLPWYGKIIDYFWHLTLPIIVDGARGLRHADAADQELVPRRDPQAVRADRARQGLHAERQVLYGHVFRNAMLIVIAGFPGAFVHAFFTGSLLIETIFSLDGLGLLGFESVLNRDYPVVFATLYIFSLVGLVGEPRSPTSPTPGSIRASTSRRGRCEVDASDRRAHSPTRPPWRARASTCRRSGVRSQCRRSTSAAGRTSRRTGAAMWSLWVFLVLFVLSLFAEFIANDKPILHPLGRQATTSRCSSAYPETEFGGDFGTAADYRDPRIVQELIKEKGGFMVWPPIRFSYDTANRDPPSPSRPRPPGC